jgi:hypothetical protein
VKIARIGQLNRAPFAQRSARFDKPLSSVGRRHKRCRQIRGRLVTLRGVRERVDPCALALFPDSRLVDFGLALASDLDSPACQTSAAGITVRRAYCRISETPRRARLARVRRSISVVYLIS